MFEIIIKPFELDKNNCSISIYTYTVNNRIRFYIQASFLIAQKDEVIKIHEEKERANLQYLEKKTSDLSIEFEIKKGTKSGHIKKRSVLCRTVDPLAINNSPIESIYNVLPCICRLTW